MPDNSNSRISKDLETRRLELQNELRQIEDSLEQNFESFQEDVNDRMRLSFWVKKYPLQTVGLAVTLGFLVGSKDNANSIAGTTVLAGVIATLKTVAARKIVEQVVKIIETESVSPDNR
ncbi:MAG TPA: hypothetical protein DCE78_05880 [Bacteroidetes bacterium]|nr:hypothetical protein [Bacteroidota bacterium]